MSTISLPTPLKLVYFHKHLFLKQKDEFYFRLWDNFAYRTDLSFPSVCSMQAVRMFTLKRTSSWDTRRLPALRPSSTCGRWALVSTCLPVNTSLSPPPTNPAKRQILSCESSLKSSHRQSECVFIFQIAPQKIYSVIVYTLVLFLSNFPASFFYWEWTEISYIH